MLENHGEKIRGGGKEPGGKRVEKKTGYPSCHSKKRKKEEALDIERESNRRKNFPPEEGEPSGDL